MSSSRARAALNAGARISMGYFEILAVIASITGLNLDRLLKRRDLKPRGPDLFRIFSVFEEAHDELTGYWKLAQWDYQPGPIRSEMRGMRVTSGSLSVYWKYPREQKWRGLLLLNYLRRGKERVPRKLLEWRGHGFTGAYEVELFPKGKAYTGTTAMIWRQPRRPDTWSGEFTKLTIDRKGRLIGTFENRGSGSKADPVVFHQRTRWNEVTV